MPIIVELSSTFQPVVGVVEQVAGVLDHEAALRRTIDRLKKTHFVVLDVVSAAAVGAVSEQHHAIFFALRRDRFAPLAKRGYRALLAAVRSLPLPDTPADPVLGHLVAKGPDGQLDLFANPQGRRFVSETCALRSLLTTCRESRTLHVLTPLDRLPKVTRGYLWEGDGQQLLLQQSHLPARASVLATVRPLPLQLLLRAQSYPAAEAESLEAASRSVWGSSLSPMHTLVANQFPPLLARALGDVVQRLLASSTCPRCGRQGCGATGVPGAREAAQAFATELSNDGALKSRR